MKRTMIVTLAALTAAGLAGCAKPAGPKTTDIEAVDRPMQELMPAPAAPQPATPDTAVYEPPLPADTLAPEPPGVPEPRLHTVVKGDTLMAIARRYCGSARRYREIARLNSELEQALQPRPAARARPPAEPATAPAPARTYRVRSGDTLWSIADELYRDRTQWHKIFEANKDKLGESGRLQVGQILTIP